MLRMNDSKVGTLVGTDQYVFRTICRLHFEIELELELTDSDMTFRFGNKVR